MDIRDVLARRASINDLLGTSNALNNLTSGPVIPTAQAPIGSTASTIGDTFVNLLNTDYGRYARSLLNSVALGLPKWALDKSGLSKKIGDATGLQYNSQGSAEKLGDLMGTFIPVDTAAKGLQAGGKAISKGAKALLGLKNVIPDTEKAGKGLISLLAKNPENMWGLGEKAVQGIRNAADKGSVLAKTFLQPAERMLPGAIAGALPSMAEQGVRSFTSGQSLPEALSGMATAGGIGALTGGITGSLSRTASNRLAEAEKAANQAVVGQVPGVKGKFIKQAAPYFGITKNTSGMKSMANADEAMSDIADTVKKFNLDIPGQLDKVAAEHSAVWENAMKEANKFLEKADTTSLLEKFAPKGKGDSPELYKVMENLPENENGLEAFRQALWDTKSQTFDKTLFPKPSDAQKARQFITETMDNLYEHVAQSAEKVGIKLPQGVKNWDEMRQAYKTIEPLAKGEAAGSLMPQKFNMGSNTWANAIASGLTGGDTEVAKDAAKGLLGIPGGKILQNAFSKALGSAEGFARPIIQAANKANVGEKIEKLAPEVAAFSGNVAGKIANANAGTLPLQSNAPALNEAQSNSSAPEVAAAQGKTQGMSYQQRIDDALKQRYEMFIKPQRPDVPYEVFYNYMKAKTYNFNPQLSGGILSFDPEYKSSYNKTSELAKKIEGSLGEASKRGKIGAFGVGVETGGQDAEAAYAMLEGVLSDYIKTQGVSDKKAKELINKAAGKGSLDQKRANIYKLITQFGANQDALTDMGVM